MVIAFSASNLDGIGFKNTNKTFSPVTTTLFSAAGTWQNMLLWDQISIWDLRVNPDWERGPQEGVMAMSAWYWLFLCGQIHHKLTDVRCSVSHSRAGCVSLFQRNNRDTEVCQPITSSINVIDDVINRPRSEWIYYCHLTQPLNPQLNHPHAGSPHSHTHTSSHTHSHKETNYNSLFDLHSTYRRSAIIVCTCRVANYSLQLCSSAGLIVKTAAILTNKQNTSL